jgi:thioredoxin-like negative regulator of GroEL
MRSSASTLFAASRTRLVKNYEIWNGGSADLERIVRNSPGVVVAGFVAPSCGVCGSMQQAVAAMAAGYEDVTFLIVDVDVSVDLVRERGVGMVPHFEILLFRNGRVRRVAVITSPMGRRMAPGRKLDAPRATSEPS